MGDAGGRDRCGSGEGRRGSQDAVDVVNFVLEV